MRRTLAAILGLAVAALAVYVLYFHHRGDAKVAPAAPSRDGKIAAPEVKPADSTRAAPRGMAPQWAFDLDPEGPLRMEGQVVDADGHGIAGAEVWLGSVPPRTTKTEGDGTFSFDKLVGRSYDVAAKSGQLIGSIEYKLTDKSDPVIVKLGAGANLVVTVLEDDKRPIASADVTLVGEIRSTVKTKDDGSATIAPVKPGWVAVQVSAPGHAAQNAFTTIGSAGATGQLQVTLHKGVTVSGRVIDEAGKPIAKAHVATTAVWDIPGGLEPTVTDDKGQFSLALAAGSHTLTANDTDHAPGHSAPVTVGDRAIGNVEIVMKTGGVLAGVVVDSAKKPVPFATVRVAGKGGNMWLVASRQTTSDRGGKFELHGLARAKLQVRAESDAAASKLVDADLTAQQATRELEIVLDVTGTISGVVVDEGGQPVPEVQVNAFPDVLGGASTDGLALAGMSSATTDGGGGFTIRGLPSDKYRLSASRATHGRDWGQEGVSAKTGDTGVKIVLATPGSLVGRIAIEGASAPPRMAFVHVGSRDATPAREGAFEVDDLPPGTYDARFYGPDFADLVRHDVTIVAGKPTDLGVIKVTHGRKLAGTVVDGAGKPVPGAKVKVGDLLFQIQGAEEQMDSFEQASGARVAITDQDGAFTLIGIPAKRTSVMADHPDRGRSNAAEIVEGTDDPPPVTLALRGFGSITGKVTLKGQPATGVTITDTPKGGGAQIQIAQTDDNGAFTVVKASEGPHVLSAMQQGGLGMSLKSTSTTVQVTAGKATSVLIDIPVGSVTLTVQIRALPGNKVDAAQVFLFHGAVAAGNAKDLTDRFLGGGVQGMKFWWGEGKPMPDFDELVPGDYSACSVPITGNLMDSSLQARLQEHMDLLKVYCKQVQITASPAQQTVIQELPSMVSLPTPKT